LLVGKQVIKIAVGSQRAMLILNLAEAVIVACFNSASHESLFYHCWQSSKFPSTPERHGTPSVKLATALYATT